MRLRMCLCILAGAMGTLLSATASGATLEDFVRAPELRSVKISPDGEHLAMLRREAVDTLYIVKRSDRSVVTGVSSGPGQRFHVFDWVSNGRLLIQPALDVQGFGEAKPTGELMSFSLDGQNNGYLRRHNADDTSAKLYRLIHLLPSQPDRVLVAEHTFSADGSAEYITQFQDVTLASEILAVVNHEHEYRLSTEHCDEGICPKTSSRTRLLSLNVETGGAELVATAPVPSAMFITSEDGSDILSFGVTGEETATTYRLEGEDWRTLNSTTKGVGALPVAIPETGRVLVLENRVDTLGLAELDLSDGRLASVFRDTTSDIEHLLHDSTGSHVLAVRFNPGFPSWHYLQPDSDFAKTHKALRAAFPDSDIEVTSFTHDNVMAIARIYSDRNPGVFYVVNTETRQADLLLPSQQWIVPDELARTQPVELAARDATTIHGYLTLPESAGAEPPPLLVLVHDRPFSSRFLWEYDAEVQLFASQGFAVLQINNRGSSGYGRRYTYGTDRELDQTMQRDILDAADWAASEELIDSERICLFGRGFGVQPMVIALASSGSRFRCTIAHGGLFDLAQPFDDRDFELPAHLSLLREHTLKNAPWSESPVDFAERIESPAMLIHGEMDRILPIAQAEAMQVALTESGNPPVSLFVSGEGHQFRDNANRQRVYVEMLEFLQTSLQRTTELPALSEAASFTASLSQDQLTQLLKVVDNVNRDIRRIREPRGASDLARDRSSSQQSTQEQIRQITRVINRRDKDARKALSDAQWPGYEKKKAQYIAELEDSLSRNKEIPKWSID